MREISPQAIPSNPADAGLPRALYVRSAVLVIAGIEHQFGRKRWLNLAGKIPNGAERNCQHHDFILSHKKPAAMPIPKS
jgi:hypothetical protein